MIKQSYQKILINDMEKSGLTQKEVESIYQELVVLMEMIGSATEKEKKDDTEEMERATALKRETAASQSENKETLRSGKCLEANWRAARIARISSGGTASNTESRPPHPPTRKQRHTVGG